MHTRRVVAIAAAFAAAAAALIGVQASIHGVASPRARHDAGTLTPGVAQRVTALPAAVRVEPTAKASWRDPSQIAGSVSTSTLRARAGSGTLLVAEVFRPALVRPAGRVVVRGPPILQS